MRKDRRVRVGECWLATHYSQVCKDRSASLPLTPKQAQRMARHLRNLGYEDVAVVRLIPRGSGGTDKSTQAEGQPQAPRSPRTKR